MLKHQPTSLLALKGLGQIAFEDADYAAARNHLTQILSMNPNDHGTHIWTVTRERGEGGPNNQKRNFFCGIWSNRGVICKYTLDCELIDEEAPPSDACHEPNDHFL